MLNIVNKITSEVKNLTSNKRVLEMLGKEGAKIIKVRTSQGFGVDQDGGSRKPLKPLKKSTIRQRERNKGKLASGVSPRKSRLTFTGEMIESIVHKLRHKKVS